MSLHFDMPFNQTLQIVAVPEIDESEIGKDEEVEGVIYKIYWNNKPLPFHTNTRLHAMAIALGCQYGAHEIFKKLI